MIDLLLSIIVWICAVGNLFLGFLVYTRKKKTVISITFASFATSAAFWTMALFFFEHPIIFSSLIWLKIVYCIVLLMTGLLFSFSFIFPRKTTRPRTLPILFFILTAIFFAYLISCTKLFVANVTLEPWGYKQILGHAYPFFASWATFFIFWALYNFYQSHKKGRGLERAQVKFIFLGMFFFTLIPIVLDAILPIFFKNSKFIWFSPISAIFLVGFTAYAIIKHRFLDIRLIIARSISYALLIITFSLIYAGGLFGLGTLITRSQGTTANSIVSAVLAIAIAFSFQPLRRFLEKITDKIFYKEKYDSNKLIYKLSLKMAENIQLDVLTGEILEILRDEMRISTASFLVITKKGLEYTIKDHNTFHSQPTKEELKLISEEGKILIFEELEKGKVKNVLRKHNLSVFTPLTTKGKRVGYLLLGEKSSGDIYYDQDIKTLSILASQFAISIQNAQSYEEITKFNKTLKQEVDKATLNLQVANKRLTELGKLKDEFFSIAAHELRTPLTAIQGNTSLIQEYFGDDIRKNKDLEEMVEDVNESSKRLIKIVNDYLDASRLEQGRIVFKNKNIDIKEIITDVVAETKELATEKNLYIKLGEEINAKLLQVFADKDRVKQVIYNLVGNAIKYTKQGGLTIHAQEENGSLLLRFEDTGIGIDPEGQQLLFQKFQQVGENHLDRKTNRGAGIGLYISKLLVESMGGKIYLEKSEVNKGSIFTFTLPLAKVAKTA